jgi:hypothetical protein
LGENGGLEGCELEFPPKMDSEGLEAGVGRYRYESNGALKMSPVVSMFKPLMCRFGIGMGLDFASSSAA